VANCEILGEGTYGMVFKAMDKSDPNKVVAIKRIYKKSLVTEELEFQQYEANVLKVILEAGIECVPKLLDVYEDATFLSFVMEYKNAPNLLTWLKENQEVDELQVKTLFYKLCSSF
jgi:3-phosphoinositide dependent protein kinase-1